MAFLRLRKTAVATAIGTIAFSPLWAQTQSPSQVASLSSVVVSAKAAPVLDAERADVSGWGVPLSQAPQSITVLGTDLLGINASASLSQAIRLDASLADSYNTTGYLENLSVRGFTLNTDGNTLRNGLAVSSYTPIALENKERVEVLKGVSGLQSGVSAPGGLINLVTKVPMPDAFSTLTVGTDQQGGSKVHLDSNTRLGALGVRVNLVQENLHPTVDNANGKRELASVAIALPLTAETSLAADLEYHHKVQRSVPGLGLLDTNGDYVGDAVPARIQPRLNLNNQSWSLPMEATSTIGQMTLKHRINNDWQAQGGFSAQRTLIDDRLAFPDGCGYVYPGLCSNGDVDMYDFRSEGELRNVRSWNAQVQGNLVALGLPQQVRFGVSGRESRTDLAPLQAYNYVGTTNIYAPIALPADPSLTALNTNSREKTTESFAAISTQWTPTVRSFAGVRVSQLDRNSARSDGSRPIALSQTVSTPWAGVAWTAQPSTTWYASWGQGVELDAVPNKTKDFVNAGEVLPAQKSEQVELGVKWQARDRLLLSAAAFSIDKPFADDKTDAGGLLRRVGGAKMARHSGLELSATGAVDSQWSVQATVSLLDARWTAAPLSPALVNKPVTNVPKAKASLFVDYKATHLPGFSVHGLLLAEGEKTANADGSTTLPASWQLDAGASYRHRIGGQSLVWNLQVENLTDRTYWREAPTTYWGATYLFASTPRTVHASVTLEF